MDIGVVYGNEKDPSGHTVRVPREINLIAAKGGKKTYIQSAYALETEDKTTVKKGRSR